MLTVNHFDSFDRIYNCKDFLNESFAAYKIIFVRGGNKIEIPCFTKMQLKNEILNLFKKYHKVNKTVNVVGIVGGKFLGGDIIGKKRTFSN